MAAEKNPLGKPHFKFDLRYFIFVAPAVLMVRDLFEQARAAVWAVRQLDAASSVTCPDKRRTSWGLQSSVPGARTAAEPAATA